MESNASFEELLRVQEQRLRELGGQAEAPVPADGRVRVDADMLTAVNYALSCNGFELIRSLTVRNGTERALENLELRISAAPAFCGAYSRHIECIPAGESLCLKNVHLVLDAELLAGLTEKAKALLRFTLAEGEDPVYREELEISLLAFDEWHGAALYPELLTAFVTPNHPEVARLAAQAARFLGEWTGDPSLDAYQSKDPNRVLAQAGAVYAALQAENIVYSVPPASFEGAGQRVRLCDAVLGQRMGTCLDLSLLYAACLEALGLHSLLILQKGHIFAGVWLEALSFPEAVQDDASLVTKRLAAGVSEIAVVECTALTAGGDISFDRARSLAEEKLSDISRTEYIIDVYRSRLSGISPLPHRIQTGEGWHIEDAAPRQNISAAPRPVAGALDLGGGLSPESGGKLGQWERKLLDLGLRNALINLRPSRTVLPILTSSPEALEDALREGEDFTVFPRPADWHISGGEEGFGASRRSDGLDALIRSEFLNRRLRADCAEGEFARSMKELYRSARVSMEENGANTLYLALGLLRWYETPRSRKARYAPVVLLPVELAWKGAARGYVLRLRDDEAQMNITMLEKLKQDFGIAVRGLDPLPSDERGVDIRRVLTILRKAVMEQARWDVLESAYLGIFSFSQFVMWNDIRNRSADLARNKIVRSLMDGKLAWAAEDMEIGGRVPEEGVYLPLPADASQLYAIEAATRGESFVLHGPPGTGKSQTITALIANALAQGRTVLFVAEKMAALEVVEKRLDELGIGPFCLELHSNKSKKRDVLDQLRQALEVTKSAGPEMYETKARQIALLRGELDAYAGQLHETLPCGLSLYELANRYEQYRDAPELPAFSAGYAAGVTAEELDGHLAALQRLGAAARAVGHPQGHPL
ncbi:MAG: DUF4011 domain-containing protein, partial [Oscillospiraceae bacterium]|nr:DUF4011 domain-containing protein [Oscillospiraceae bacterium]